jgi:hypothetical protein
VTTKSHAITAVKPMTGPAEPGRYFVANQRRVPVAMLKPGQWVHLDPDSAWHEVTKVGRPYDAPVPGTAAKQWRKFVTLEFANILDQTFLASSKLWTRNDEEGN